MIAIPALILPFLIRAAVVEGVATAVEVSTIGIAYTIVAGLFIYRQFDWRRVWPMLVDTASLSGSILFIVGTATAMAWALTQSGFSRELALVMAKVPGGAAGFMALSIVVFVILGSVLEGVPALVLLAPLLFPIAQTDGHPRGALFDGGDPRDGDRAVRAAVRGRLLHRLRDRQCRSRTTRCRACGPISARC